MARRTTGQGRPGTEQGRRTLAVAGALALGAGMLAAGPAAATDHPRAGRGTPPPATTSAGDPVDLDVLFVGAHPDDEASALSTFGQWRQSDDVRTGVVTVTRGEGGGNAAGPEEGPELGLLREVEERSAVGLAGVRDVFNLDDVDFYYTVSAPLTQQIWGEEDALEKVVRLVRETRPEVVVTMNPAPSPGNHGNHQEAARLALEAYQVAGDPSVFPEQLTQEGLEPFSPDRVLLNTVAGTRATGPACPQQVQLSDPTQTVYGVWSGAQAPDGRTWGQVERAAQRQYVSQGWATFPDVPADPDALGCDYLTQVDARVPSAEPGTEAASSPDAALQGALVRGPDAAPLGTGLTVQVPGLRVVPGEETDVVVRASAGRTALGGASVALEAPDGWAVTGDGALGDVAADGSAQATFTVTAPADARPGTRVRLAAELSSDVGGGWAAQVVETAAPVRGQLAPLDRVAEYEGWAREVGFPELQGTVRRVTTLPSGGTQQVDVVVTNDSTQEQSGTTALGLPDGFSAEATEQAFGPLAAGDSATVPFTVTNTDDSLPTSNAGGEGGDHPFTVTTTAGGVTSTSTPALELVPTTDAPGTEAAAVVDGVEQAGEHPGEELDLSRLWEGTPCESAADCSATGKLSWHDDALQVLVHVTDDVAGTVLPAADCKRHWRTDSVEIAVDPRGDAENTSTTFKAFVLPRTAEGGPCAGRDADARQGPAARTAPGMEYAVTPDDDGTAGYTLEVTIPLGLLPAAVDPDEMAVDLFVYDSDTQDKTGQTRIGWSTWQGVQGDPYRWGVVRLPGYTPPADRPAEPAEPVIPQTALSSLESPPSIAQAVRDDVPLAGGPAAPAGQSAWLRDAVQRRDAVVATVRATGPGRLHLWVWDPQAQAAVAGSVVDVEGSGPSRWWVTLPEGAGDVSGTRLLAAFEAEDGGTLSSVAPVR
ncbi:sugar-binding protein [Pseudokineococcus basanitobsidens]